MEVQQNSTLKKIIVSGDWQTLVYLKELRTATANEWSCYYAGPQKRIITMWSKSKSYKMQYRQTPTEKDNIVNLTERWQWSGLYATKGHFRLRAENFI
jgi:hypothetical protein